ncbi:MAG TPA: hypothetical protein VIW68_14915 [Candidatus Sulfotelmatobacter sp.]
MPELWKDFTEKLGNLAGKWTAYAALGSFLLYLLGYLTFRFQLSTYGVATDLDLFDEKYLFAGCRFVVYLVSAVPNILILFLILAAIAYLPYKLLPMSLKQSMKHRAASWCAEPLHLPLLGVVLAVALIQFVLRKCFSLGNLLLRGQLPDGWASSVLLASDGILSVYFMGLVAGTLLTGFILFYGLQRESATTAAARFWVGVLAFLLAVEFLLLPVNYGVLISTQQLPRVSELSTNEKPATGQRNWLIWDSKDALTYFVRDAQDQRMIVTVPRKDAKVRIVAYDDIFCVLFGGNHVETRPCPR